jgi:polyhydroxybutyrate depolymerase
MLLALLLLAAPAEPKKVEWKVDDNRREALVVASSSSEPAPLVFVWHGHGGTMRHAANTMGFHKQWPDAVVVYPQGLPTPGALTDPEGKLPGWQKIAGDQSDRDLKFFDEMLKSLKKDHKIDEKRIYSTGHSNGGAFTYLLWSQRGDVFAAVAPSAAGGRAVQGIKPLPCLHVMGESDPLVRPELQKRTLDVVKKTNGCDAEGKSWAGRRWCSSRTPATTSSPPTRRS